MKINEEGLNIIKRYEGCKLTAYKCPAGVWTIGFGHTYGVSKGMVITQSEAEDYLIRDLIQFESHVNNVNEMYDYNFNDNEFSALVSFAFNIGSIWQLCQYGRRSKYQISDAIMNYIYADGKALPGLILRRKDEHDLFMTVTQPTMIGDITFMKR